MDFYEHLGALESEALRRARSIGAAEARAARDFYRNESEKPEHVPPPPPAGKGGLGRLLGGRGLPRDLFSSPDFSLIACLLLILNSEQSDPLLLLALAYILM